PSAATLIIITTIGSAVHAFQLWLGIKGSAEKKFSLFKPLASVKKLRATASSYKDFPFYRSPQVLIFNVSDALPVLMLAAFFGPAAAGFYSLSRSILGAPVTLIGRAVGQVFYPHF